MAEIKLKAYPVSKMQFKKLREKFRAFASADCSERAEKEGAWKSDIYGTGWYFTRSACVDSVWYVCDDGDLDDRSSDGSNAGVRVALQTIYNPKCNPAKGWRSVKRTVEIWNPDKQGAEKVTDEAPVVKFGKKEYIWLNKEECENGKSQVMDLVSLELVARSVPFDKNGETNDFAKATEMHKKYYEVARENCTKEELSMIVTGKMSDKDNYNEVTPILKTKEQQEWQDEIIQTPSKFLELPTKFFADEEFVCECLDIAKEAIREETMGLEEVTDEYVSLVGEQLKSFSEKIEKEKETVKAEEVKAEKTNKNRASVLAMLDGKGEGK